MPNTIELYANNARTTLSGSANNTVTTLVLQSGAGALFPSPNNTIGEYAKATLQDSATGLRNEIVYITARTGDVLTVTRGQDGSTAQTWSAGDTVFEGVTAATLASFVQPSKLQSGEYIYASATGSTTAYIAALTPAIATVNAGLVVRINTNTIGTNTTTTPTLNVNGLGAFTIVKQGGAVRVGDMPKMAQLQYDSTLTQWVLLNPNEATNRVPVGTVLAYSGNGSPPAGFVFDDAAALSRTAYPDLFALYVTNAGFTSQTFTVTIASPAVFTKTAHGFTDGERLRLSTTGALPTGLNTTIDYFVERLTDNTFYLTTSVYGVATRVITTGTQSGAHSYLQSLYGLGDGSTTFNVINGAGVFYRSTDRGRGIDIGRAIGTTRKGTLTVADTYNTNISSESAVETVTVPNNPTLAEAQRFSGVDVFTVADYTPLVVNYLPTSGYSSLPLTGGTGGVSFAAGVSRPTSIAVPYIIKF